MMENLLEYNILYDIILIFLHLCYHNIHGIFPHNHHL